MFSVLLSVYSKEDPLYLDCALDSIWTSQKKKPDQVVLVKDGPLTDALEAIINDWRISLKDVLTIVTLEVNKGLAAALNEGLTHCRYDLVARMDTDDVALPDRFHKQSLFMDLNPDITVCSGQIEEWSQNLSHKLSERRLPQRHNEILKFSKSRSPVSHPAVMFRKSAVIASGGYPEIYPEDYPLWGTMLAKGYKFANLPDTLLKMRVGNALIERRGKDFLKGQIAGFRHLYKIGLINKFELIRNIFLTSVVRLSPIWFKRVLYKYFR